MKTLVIGDIHGYVDIVRRALATPYDLIFVGDYLDSFTNSAADHLTCLDMVLTAQREGRAIALQGNHERSYLGEYCSGFDAVVCQKLDAKGYIDTPKFGLNELLPYCYDNGFLISHAGVSQYLLDIFDTNHNEYLVRGDYSQVGRTRGGSYPAGGLFWCDWRNEFEPVPGVKQIVGHTHSTMIREKDGNFCIDCLPYEKRSQGYSTFNTLLIENGKAELYEL